MGRRKILVCPNSASVENGILTLPTSWVGDPFDPYRDFFYFEHTEPFTIQMGNGIAHGNLETYTENDGWITWIGQGVPATHFRGMYVFPLRGTGNTSISVYNTNIYSFKTMNSVQGVRACGNIECLLDYETVGMGEHPTMDEQCFACLFEKNSKFDITGLKLPATELSQSCYQSMCQGCTYSTPIELPATTLADYCYLGMFEGASIEEAPLLPAETLAPGCYMGMFKNSTLSTAPELPAYTLAISCYESMFEGCYYLTTPPELPAYTLSGSCYKQMFMNSGVTSTPVWNQSHNTYLGTSSCQAMFKGCQQLEQASLPLLGVDSLGVRCFYEMFSGCTSYTGADGAVRYIHTETVKFEEECCAYMFQNCTGMRLGGWIYYVDNSTPAKGCFKGMYKGCTAYSSAYSGGMTHNISNVDAESCCESMYEGCVNLTTPPNMSVSAIGNSALKKMFKGCSKLRYVHIFAQSAAQYTAGTYACEEMFCQCTLFGNQANLQSHPAFTTMSEGSFKKMYYGCTGMQSPPSLLSTVMATRCYESMFEKSGITTAPALMATTLAEGCYYSMFEYCGSLTTPPSLPATQLAAGCYESMFQHSGITSAPSLPATTLETRCYKSMFEECASLTTAASIAATVYPYKCCEDMYAYCTALTSAPDMTVDTIGLAACDHMFFASGLTASPKITANVIHDNGCYAMFYFCSWLTTAGDITATSVGGLCFMNMFHRCHRLQNAPHLDLGTGELLNGTCEAMFKECTNLETIPEILATGVAGAYISSSFEEMFSGCSKIKISETQTGEYVNAYNVPALRTTQGTTPITTVVNMFANTGGTFTGSPTAGGVYYTSNTIV